MALINPSNLYSGEAERFNSQPSVNMAVNLMAKRQAREDALDAYDKNRINSINPKGLRDIDRQGFDAAIADLQQTYRQNKDAIRKGTTPEAFNYEKKFRGISDYISKSQDAAARGETAFKIREEAKKKNQLLPNSFAQEIELNEKPISQGHVPFDYNKWANRPNNFDQSKALARYKDIAPVEAEITTSPIAGDNFMVLQTTKKKLTPEQKNTVKARAISDYHEMEDFNNAVNTDIADPTKRASLIATYQKHFNEVPKDPEDFAAAKILELKQGELEESKAVPNWEGKQKYNEAMRKRLASYNSALIEGRTRRNPYSGVNYQEGIIFDKIGETNPVPFSGKPVWAGGTGVSGKIIDGYAYDDNGKPITGEIEVDAENLPSLLFTVLKDQKINLSPSGKTKLTVQDGTITNLKTDQAGQIDRNSMKTYQLFKNKEPIKGEQPIFGNTRKVQPQPTKKPTKGKLY